MCSGEPKSRWGCGSGERITAVGPRRPSVPTTRTATRVASAVLRVRRPTAAPWAPFSALHRPASLSAANDSPPPRHPTARDLSQGHATRHQQRSPSRLQWTLARETASAPDQQLRVGRPWHTCTQLTRCQVASKPSGLRSLQDACEPSRPQVPAYSPRQASPGRASAASRIQRQCARQEQEPNLAYSVVGLSSAARRAAK